MRPTETKSSVPVSPHAIAEILARFPHDRSELLPALDALNSGLGHLPAAAIESVARHFGLSPGEVYGAATFYSMWHVGEAPGEMAHLCDDGPCHASGAAHVRRALERAGIEIRRTSCIGQCGHGPVVVAGDQLYRRVRPDTLHAILTGEEPAPLSPAAEIIGAIVDDPAHSLLRHVGKINPRSLEEAVAVGAYDALCARHLR